jgi:hypothetical protein
MSLDEWGSLGATQQAIEDAIADRAATKATALLACSLRGRDNSARNILRRTFCGRAPGKAQEPPWTMWPLCRYAEVR